MLLNLTTSSILKRFCDLIIPLFSSSSVILDNHSALYVCDKWIEFSLIVLYLSGNLFFF